MKSQSEEEILVRKVGINNETTRNMLFDNPTTPINNDDELKKCDSEAMKNHSDEYTKLLKAYVKNVEATLKDKRAHKWVFFIFSVLVLGAITYTLGMVIYYVYISSINDTNFIVDINIISLLTTVLISFLTTFIVIPNIITNYLFNIEEEKNMSTIIKNIQEYDSNIRSKM